MKFTYTITKNLLQSLTTIASLEERLKSLSLSTALRTTLFEQAKIRTSHFSNKIEGNCLTLEQTEDVWKHKKVDAPKRDIQEVKNVFDLFDFLLDEARSILPLTEEFVLTIHRTVEQHIVKGKLLGHYREAQNAVFDASTHAVVYMPPEAKDVAKLMKEFIHELNTLPWEHPLIKAAIAHFGLVTIHPFMDGNGRTARAVSTFVLMQSHLQFIRYFAWDEYFYHHRSHYYAILHHSQGNNFYGRDESWDVQQWIEFFVYGVEQSILRFLEHIESKKYFDELNKRQQKALRFLKRHHAISNREYRQLNKISNVTACAELKDLEDKGLIKRIGAGRASKYTLKI